MKRFVLAGLLLALLSGCTTTGVGGVFGGVDDSLLNQVPSSEMGSVYSAMDRLDLAREELKLAELREDRAGMAEKLAGYEKDLADNMVDQREIEADIAKMETIIAAELGDSVETAKKLNDLRSDKLENETKRIEIEADVRKEAHRIEDMDARIARQEGEIERLKQFKAADTEPVEDVKADEPVQQETLDEPAGEKVNMPAYLKVEDDPDATPDKPDHPEDIEESGLAE
ncbi:hypothetical protein [Salidesulfovibrio brasiliensis]|uniref:hypothetical protein n=1 Tax=Salidesulfovibrio brasiliensis TaxID=221711 RepID=UPI0006D037CA|nr:hypothetical protein [Salidesulfovibrio brasiliensis]